MSSVKTIDCSDIEVENMAIICNKLGTITYRLTALKYDRVLTDPPPPPNTDAPIAVFDGRGYAPIVSIGASTTPDPASGADTLNFRPAGLEPQWALDGFGARTLLHLLDKNTASITAPLRAEVLTPSTDIFYLHDSQFYCLDLIDHAGTAAVVFNDPQIGWNGQSDIIFSEQPTNIFDLQLQDASPLDFSRISKNMGGLMYSIDAHYAPGQAIQTDAGNFVTVRGVPNHATQIWLNYAAIDINHSWLNFPDVLNDKNYTLDISRGELPFKLIVWSADTAQLQIVDPIQDSVTFVGGGIAGKLQHRIDTFTLAPNGWLIKFNSGEKILILFDCSGWYSVEYHVDANKLIEINVDSNNYSSYAVPYTTGASRAFDNLGQLWSFDFFNRVTGYMQPLWSGPPLPGPQIFEPQPIALPCRPAFLSKCNKLTKV